MAEAKTKEFKYPEALLSDMPDSESIDGKVEHEDNYRLEEWRAFSKEMLPRMRMHGTEMKFGDSESCLPYRGIKSYARGQLDEETKAEYDAHMAGCKVCGPLMRAYQDFLEKTRPQDLRLE